MGKLHIRKWGGHDVVLIVYATFLVKKVIKNLNIAYEIAWGCFSGG